jgi:signal transduction histidine kinase
MMTTIKPLTNYLIACLLSVFVLTACDETPEPTVKIDQADSLINAAYIHRDYNELISLANELQEHHALSDMKAYYWLGYSYSRLRQMRSAELYWKKAVALTISNDEDLEFYGKSANRLASLQLFKGDYETTLRVALSAMKRMQEMNYTSNSDFANLLTSIGGCQLKLGRDRDAAESYAQAYQIYTNAIKSNDDINNYTTAIIGVITTTDNYLQAKHFQEARLWTDRFEELLRRYEMHPKANPQTYDKEQARLLFYRACALEGLGFKNEARNAYEEALKTQYAHTDDGLNEATNYLVSAERWSEAADNYKILDMQMRKYNIQLTLDNIQLYLLPKYRANIGAHRNDTALKVGLQICNQLDSAIIKQKQDDAAELATIYDTQKKETEIAEQRAYLSRQRFIATTIALILVTLFFGVFIYFRHRAAKRLEEANKKLAEKNELLTVANARAEESSRMKTAFIQQISHEIRTPLNILSGFTQIITTPGMQLDDDTKSDINRQISENTNRITGLVNKMLELSDAGSRAVIECSDEVLAIQIAAQAVEDSRITSDKQVVFDMQVAEGAETAMLKTHEKSAERALSLLLDNARKFLTKPTEAPKGTVRLKISLSPEDSKCMFIVEDTGIGVPASEAEHIFDEFVQLDEYYDGTGIGLTVARSLARRLGGDIHLDTSYSNGARFVMTLPC